MRSRSSSPRTGGRIGVATWGNALLTREPLADGFAVSGLPARRRRRAGRTGRLRPDALAGITFRDAPYGTREPRCVVGGHLARRRRDHRGHRHPSRVRRGTAQRPRRPTPWRASPTRRLARSSSRATSTRPSRTRSSRALAGFVDAFDAVGVPPGDPRRASSGPARIDHLLGRGAAASSTAGSSTRPATRPTTCRSSRRSRPGPSA